MCHAEYPACNICTAGVFLCCILPSTCVTNAKHWKILLDKGIESYSGMHVYYFMFDTSIAEQLTECASMTKECRKPYEMAFI